MVFPKVARLERLVDLSFTVSSLEEGTLFHVDS